MKNITVPALALAAILVAVAFALILPRDSAAQELVTVNGYGVENQFPKGLRFHIDAESETPIDEIRVYVRKLGQSSRTTYRAVEFEPGHVISGDVLFESQTSNEYIPPGTRLEYHFDIRTADGVSIETEPDTIVYLNTGLDWDVKSSGLIDVYYYDFDRLSEVRAEAVLAIAAETYDYMAPILGVELVEPMSIVVYSNYDHMRQALRPDSRVAARHLRKLGQAFSNERTLLVDGSNDLLSGDRTLTTAAHEFTHLLVADAAGSAYSTVHSWLNEGLAVYSERQADDEYARYMDRAIRANQVPPLAGLRNFAGTPDETLRAYGQGFAVVQYMLDEYGVPKMTDLFVNIRTTHNVERALLETYGLTLPELDNEWRASVGLAPRDLSTPPPPPLQVLPTRRPTPAPPAASPVVQPPATQPSTAQAVPTPTPAPVAQAATTPAEPTDTPQPTTQSTAPPAPSGGGCGAAPAPSGDVTAELASLALLAAPAGLLALAGLRRRRDNPPEPAPPPMMRKG